LIIGAGGLGCPLILYLAYSGVGNLGIVDNDKVEAIKFKQTSTVY
jgi:adenylyltransferase/sulfurtransferase